MSFVDDAVKQKVKQDCEISFLFNPLFHEFYFTSVFKGVVWAKMVYIIKFLFLAQKVSPGMGASHSKFLGG